MGNDTAADISRELRSMADPDNAKFVRKLVPNTNREILGVRLPQIRKLAKRIAKGDWRGFVQAYEPENFEECTLAGILIGYAETDFDEKTRMYRNFVPMIDNWAVCDCTCATLKLKDAEKQDAWDLFTSYLRVPNEYGMRFGVIMILSNFINAEYIDRILDEMDSVKDDGYYLKMAVAWTLSVCFVKFREKTMSYLEDNTLDDFTFNKTLQKITESYRVDDVTKRTIRGMKRKPVRPSSDQSL